MKWTHLKSGLRLEMTPILSSGEPAAMRVNPVSQLLQPVTDPGWITVAVPIHLSRHVNWPAGSRLMVSFTEQNRGIWQFRARILAVKDVDWIRSYVLCAETELYRLQRRAHFRVNCSLDVTLTLKSPNRNAQDRIIQAVTCDISGGGVCILLDQMLPDGLSVRLRISLGNGRLFTTNSYVVRTQLVQIGHAQRYKVSLQYLDIPRQEQDSLIRCLMSWQKRQNVTES